jgi:hypothetical protein
VTATPPRRLWRAGELLLLFGVAPLVLAWVVRDLRISIFLALPPLFVAVIAILLWDRSFSLRAELARLPSLRLLAGVLATFIVAGGAIALYMRLEQPHAFLSFPRFNPRLWLLVMLLYPVLSALPQELVYRTFFFHRYGALFGSRRGLAIALNGALFGFGHIVMQNLAAVLLSALLGVVLAARYDRHRSLWAAWLEHTLWGQFVFTVGLGRYFFTGVSNF